MRIGIIADPIEYGPLSIKKYVINLVKHLVKMAKDEEFFLITVKAINDPKIVPVEELRQIILPFTYKKKKSLFLHRNPITYIKGHVLRLLNTYSFQKIVSDMNIDIIHIPNFLAEFATHPLGYLSLSGKSKLIVTLHGIAPLTLPPRAIWKELKLLRHVDFTIYSKISSKLLKDRISLVITVSKSEKRNISRKLSIPEEKIKVIYHGVSDAFKPLSNKEEIMKRLSRKYNIDSPFIFHVSSYQPRKNVEGIIKAFAVCKRKYGIEEKLVIGGKQPYKLRSIVKHLGLEKDVIFTGYIDEKDLPLFYNVAEVFVFPSFYEAFGMPILEAMASGCPLITSNVYAMPEIAGDATVLVNPYNVNEIAEAIYNVLSDKNLRRRLIQKGLRRAKMFSWEKCAEEHLKVYKMVMENERGL